LWLPARLKRSWRVLNHTPEDTYAPISPSLMGTLGKLEMVQPVPSVRIA
jgi:hypothetical protein